MDRCPSIEAAAMIPASASASASYIASRCLRAASETTTTARPGESLSVSRCRTERVISALRGALRPRLSRIGEICR